MAVEIDDIMRGKRFATVVHDQVLQDGERDGYISGRRKVIVPELGRYDQYKVNADPVAGDSITLWRREPVGKSGLDRWRRKETRVVLSGDLLPQKEIIVKRPFGLFTWTGIRFNGRDRHRA